MVVVVYTKISIWVHEEKTWRKGKKEYYFIGKFETTEDEER